MRERAKEVLLKLKSEKREIAEAFDNYVKHLVEELEIEESLAVTLVTDDLVNEYESRLIMHELFKKSTLEQNNVK